MRHGQSCVCLTRGGMRPAENSLCIGSGPVNPKPAGYALLARLVLTMRHAKADTRSRCCRRVTASDLPDSVVLR